jgi:hypothetical protein
MNTEVQNSRYPVKNQRNAKNFIEKIHFIKLDKKTWQHNSCQHLWTIQMAQDIFCTKHSGPRNSDAILNVMVLNQV